MTEKQPDKQHTDNKIKKQIHSQQNKNYSRNKENNIETDMT